MIPFFRKIRKKLADDNKPLKYMRYAIGEIVLVVIGILIALQINNWNVKKSQQEKIKEYAKFYIQDLEADIAMTNINWKMIDNVSQKIDSLALSIQNKKIEDVSKVINSLVRLQAYYDIRSNIELPQLTDDAEELIALLKAEYLD